MHGNSPSILIPILDACATPNAVTNPSKGPSGNASASPVDSGTTRWDLSTPEARRASASEYRQSDGYKSKRSEKRRAGRANEKKQVRNAAVQEQPTSLQIASLPSGRGGYTGSLRREDSAAAEELWVHSERMTAMSTLTPVPYELSPPLLKAGECH
jgi:hypothetical protein